MLLGFVSVPALDLLFERVQTRILERARSRVWSYQTFGERAEGGRAGHRAAPERLVGA
jgi:hypothetical protein